MARLPKMTSGAPAGAPEEQYEGAKELALKMLAASPKSRHQLLTRLGRARFDEAVAVRVVDRLEELGLVNEQELADHLVAKGRHKGYGSAAIFQDLATRGLTPASEDPSAEEEERAIKVAADKVRRLRAASPAEVRTKLLRFLASRGFDYEAAIAACDHVMGRAEAETD